MFKFVDGLLGNFVNVYLKSIFGFYIPGAGLLLSAFIVLIAGFFATYFLGRQMFLVLERIILKLPFSRYIYPAIKQFINFLFSREKISFKKVVLVEYPRKGIWSLAFVTNEGMPQARKILREDLLNIFVPFTPGPFSGYYILVKRQEVVFLDISVEEALRVLISGGVLNPQILER
jgi:uncharacterized membrane protein